MKMVLNHLYRRIRWFGSDRGSIVLGILLAVLFGAANAYLGLRVGMTVSASIPAAVISMGVIV